MSIETDARQEAERRWPRPNNELFDGLIIGFVQGAVWAHEQTDREPSDAEVEAGARALAEKQEGRKFEDLSLHLQGVWRYEAHVCLSAALLAAQEVRRGD